MKSIPNQFVTVLSLLTFAFVSTLVISWGITKVVYPDKESPLKSHFIIKVKEETKNDIMRKFKRLIPKLK